MEKNRLFGRPSAEIGRRAFLSGAAAFAACPAAAQAAPLPVVASFSILADFVRAVGGERLRLSTIVGADGDAHVYQPSPADGRAIAGARLVFVNGLGFEGWIDRLIRATRTRATIVVASKGVSGRSGDEGLDPHAWQDVANAKRYVENIRDALIAADPDRAESYNSAAQSYLAQLEALDAEMLHTLGAIPKERRRIVSTHDAFGYFAARYGVEFVAPQGVSTEAEASARDIARIIDEVKRSKASAVFLENISDARLMRRIAAETGVKIGGVLYSDALSGGESGASTYIDMMRHNLRELVKAMAQ